MHGRFKIVSLDGDKIFAHRDVALQCNKVWEFSFTYMNKKLASVSLSFFLSYDIRNEKISKY